LYSPQIDPKLIPIIYRKAKEAKKPMTKYVNAIIRSHLAEQVADTPTSSEPTTTQTKPKAA